MFLRFRTFLDPPLTDCSMLSIYETVLIAITRPNDSCFVPSQTVCFVWLKRTHLYKRMNVIVNKLECSWNRCFQYKMDGLLAEDVVSRILLVGWGWCDCDLPCTFRMSWRTGWSTFLKTIMFVMFINLSLVGL